MPGMTRPSSEPDPRVDVDKHAAVGALGIGGVLVTQNVRAAVLVDHRCLHWARPYSKPVSTAAPAISPTSSAPDRGSLPVKLPWWHTRDGLVKLLTVTTMIELLS